MTKLARRDVTSALVACCGLVDGLLSWPRMDFWDFGHQRRFPSSTTDKDMKVMNGSEHQVLRNLPGQRIGAKAWFNCFQDYLREELGFRFCPECVLE